MWERACCIDLSVGGGGGPGGGVISGGLGSLQRIVWCKHLMAWHVGLQIPSVTEAGMCHPKL